MSVFMCVRMCVKCCYSRCGQPPVHLRWDWSQSRPVKAPVSQHGTLGRLQLFSSVCVYSVCWFCVTVLGKVSHELLPFCFPMKSLLKSIFNLLKRKRIIYGTRKASISVIRDSANLEKTNFPHLSPWLLILTQQELRPFRSLFVNLFCLSVCMPRSLES